MSKSSLDILVSPYELWKSFLAISIERILPQNQYDHGYYSGIFFFFFCQYFHIEAGILSFGGDVFRL